MSKLTDVFALHMDGLNGCPRGPPSRLLRPPLGPAASAGPPRTTTRRTAKATGATANSRRDPQRRRRRVWSSRRPVSHIQIGFTDGMPSRWNGGNSIASVHSNAIACIPLLPSQRSHGFHANKMASSYIECERICKRVEPEKNKNFISFQNVWLGCFLRLSFIWLLSLESIFFGERFERSSNG